MTLVQSILHQLRFDLLRLRAYWLTFLVLLTVSAVDAASWVPEDLSHWFLPMLPFLAALLVVVATMQLDNIRNSTAFARTKPATGFALFGAKVILVLAVLLVSGAVVAVVGMLLGFPAHTIRDTSLSAMAALGIWVLPAALLGRATNDLVGAVLLAVGATSFAWLAPLARGTTMAVRIDPLVARVALILCVYLLLESLWRRIPRSVLTGVTVLACFGACGVSMMYPASREKRGVLANTTERLHLEEVRWPERGAEPAVMVRLRLDSLQKNARYDLLPSRLHLWFVEGDSVNVPFGSAQLGGVNDAPREGNASRSPFLAPGLVGDVPTSTWTYATVADSNGITHSTSLVLHSAALRSYAGRHVAKAVLHATIAREAGTSISNIPFRDNWQRTDGVQQIRVRETRGEMGESAGRPQWLIQRTAFQTGRDEPNLGDGDGHIVSPGYDDQLRAVRVSMSRFSTRFWLLPGTRKATRESAVEAPNDSIAALVRSHAYFDLTYWEREGRFSRSAELRYSPPSR
ncbi:MAG TPA: hypothetical protein VGE27_05135 [Gemmatimonas sp.]|uniref:hypothetical protein n=1 Tax=Gemmatimonas sp. TaxID=1962908 RepID=UPI002EDBA119